MTTPSLPTDTPYETTDLGVVAYLLLLDVEPLALEDRLELFQLGHG